MAITLEYDRKKNDITISIAGNTDTVDGIFQELLQPMVETNRDSHKAFVRALSEGEQILVYFKDTCLSPEAKRIREDFYGHFLILDVVDEGISLLEYFISHFKSDTKGACSKFQELQNLGLDENSLIYNCVSSIVENVDLRQQIAASTENNAKLKAENEKLAASNLDRKAMNAQLIDRNAWLATRNAELTARNEEAIFSNAFLIKHANYGDHDPMDADCSTAPNEFKCPISHEVMIDPVVISSGRSYERAAIWKWFKAGRFTCPATGLPALEVVTKSDLVPNISLRQLIQDWRVREGSLESTATAAAVAAKAAQTAQATHAEVSALLLKLNIRRVRDSLGCSSGSDTDSSETGADFADDQGVDSDSGHVQYPSAQPGGIVFSDEDRGLQEEGNEVVLRNLHLQLIASLGDEIARRLQVVERESLREREAEEESRRDRERGLVLNRFLLMLHGMSVSPAREADEVSAERQAHQDLFSGTLAVISDVDPTGRLDLLVANDARLARAREERVRNYYRQSLFRTDDYPENNRSYYSAGSGYDSDTLSVD